MGCCATSPSDARNKSQPVVETGKNLRPPSFPSTQDEPVQREKSGPMTETEIQNLVFEFFDKYDTNNDDYLDRTQVEAMLNDLYSRKKKDKKMATKDEVMNFFKVSDKDRDYLISKHELYNFYRHHK